MERVWQLQDAKNRFSEVINKAIHEGPQVVTRRGEEIAVVISKEDYNRLRKSDLNLVDFFRLSPLAESGLDLDRDESPLRDVDL